MKWAPPHAPAHTSNLLLVGVLIGRELQKVLPHTTPRLPSSAQGSTKPSTRQGNLHSTHQAVAGSASMPLCLQSH